MQVRNPSQVAIVPIELMLLTALKALVELAGLFLLGQGVLYVLAGRKREGNYFYGLFRTLTRPVLRATRAVTPKFVIDRHIPYVALLLLFWLWVMLIWAMAQVCSASGLDCRAIRQGSAQGAAEVRALRLGAGGFGLDPVRHLGVEATHALEFRGELFALAEPVPA